MGNRIRTINAASISTGFCKIIGQFFSFSNANPFVKLRNTWRSFSFIQDHIKSVNFLIKIDHFMADESILNEFPFNLSDFDNISIIPKFSDFLLKVFNLLLVRNS